MGVLGGFGRYPPPYNTKNKNHPDNSQAFKNTTKSTRNKLKILVKSHYRLSSKNSKEINA